MGRGLGLLLAGLDPAEAAQVAALLATCSAVELEAGAPYFRSSFPDSALLVVEDGFVVVRAAARGSSRSIIACEAGPGRLVLPPSSGEALFGLVAARLTSISPGLTEELLDVRGAAQLVFAQLAASLGREQEAIGNFGNTRHVERVRLKLLQLGRTYGRVSRDGIRIDFPVSHAVLAEMIGSSRETVTRAVDELQRTGFVARRGHTYRLLVSPEQMEGETAESVTAITSPAALRVERSGVRRKAVRWR
jgi:CRP-like cAMP-binding protein